MKVNPAFLKGTFLQVAGLSLSIGIVVTALIVAASVAFQTFGNAGPVIIDKLDPENLGGLCVGKDVPVRNHFTVGPQSIVTYRISISKKDSPINMQGTQIVFPGYLYPDKSDFEQDFPWIVPELPSGKYDRIFSATGLNDYNKPFIVKSTFTIKKKEECNE